MPDPSHSGELVLVRVRNHGRTYWLAADGALRRSFPPHISRYAAQQQLEDTRGQRYETVHVFADQRSLQQANALVAQHLADRA